MSDDYQSPRRPPVSRPNPSITESRRPKRPTPKPATIKRGDTDIEDVIGCGCVTAAVVLWVLWVVLVFLLLVGAVRWVWSEVDDNHDDGAQVTTGQDYHR